MNISENIRLIRKEAGITQQAFAKVLQIKRCSLGAYEEGRCDPPVKVLVIISTTYGVSLDDLITRKLSEVWKNGVANAKKSNPTLSSREIHAIRMAANVIAGIVGTKMFESADKG